MSFSNLISHKQVTRDLEDMINASRAEALTQIISSVVWIALFGVVSFFIASFSNPQARSSVELFGVMFLILLGLHLARKQLSFRLRAGVFVTILYIVSLISLFSLGIGGAGRPFLIGVAVLMTVLYGSQAGRWGTVGILATWLVVAIAYTVFGLQPSAPPASDSVLDWFSAGVGLLMVTVALVVPQRQFLETQVFAATISQQKDDLEKAQAQLERQTADLERASVEVKEANQRLQDQSRALERRAQQLTVSAEVARVASSFHDLATLLDATVSLISERFNFYHAGIFLVDDAREWAVLQAASSTGGKRMLARGHRLRVGQQGIVGYVTSHVQPRIALDVGADATYFNNPDLPDTHSEMAVPLKARGELIGALDVQSVERNAFTAEDTKVLQTLADQLGVAIENARLFESTQRSLEELRALQHEARRASLGQAGAATAFRYDGVDIRPMPQADLSPTEETPEVLQIPIAMGDQTFGRLEMKRQGAYWSSEDAELSTAVANRMALALENARLFETTRATLAETARSYNASRAVAAAQNLDDILRAVIEHAVEPPIERFVIGLLEFDRQQNVSAMRISAWWEPGQGAQLGGGGRSTVEQFPLLGHLRATSPLIIPAISESVVVDEKSRQLFAAQNVEGVAAIPMQTGGTLVGVFLAETRLAHEFTKLEVQTLQSLADQAAVAIENIRLLEETQRRVAELATLNNLSQALTSQLDIRALTNLVGERICGIFNVKDAYVALYDGRTNMIEFPYHVENGTPLYRPPFPMGQGLSSIVIRTKKPLLINENAQQKSAELGAVITGQVAQSFLAVPIIVGDNVIGLISVQSVDESGRFSEADVRLLSTIAFSVGVGIQNARLFEQTQQRVRREAQINAITSKLRSSLSIEGILDTAAQELGRALGLPKVTIELQPGAQPSAPANQPTPAGD